MTLLKVSEVTIWKVVRWFIIPILVVFIQEIVLRDRLLAYSIKHVPQMQVDFAEYNWFFEWMVYQGSPAVLGLILTCSFMMMDKASSMYLWSTSIMMYFLANIMKSLYAQQRLYMITDEVTSYLCFTGFGNPSSEVYMNFFVHTSLFLHAYDQNEKFMKQYCLHFIWPFLGLIYFGLHAFGHVVLGANSINQVLFGALLGGKCAVIMNYWLKPFYIYLTRYLTDREIN